MTHRIRPATPGDAVFVAQVILLASRSHLARGAWDLSFAAPEARCRRYLEGLALADLLSFCHYSVYLVAEVDGRPAAALSGFDPRELGGLDPNPAIREVVVKAGWTEADFEAAQQRIAPFLTCVADPPRGAWVVEFVATLPEFRRRGLVNGLLEAVLEKGRHTGHRLAQIELLIGNTPAQRAYEKVGFRAVEDRTHPDFETLMGCPGIRRLWREL